MYLSGYEISKHLDYEKCLKKLVKIGYVAVDLTELSSSKIR